MNILASLGSGLIAGASILLSGCGDAPQDAVIDPVIPKPVESDSSGVLLEV